MRNSFRSKLLGHENDGPGKRAAKQGQAGSRARLRREREVAARTSTAGERRRATRLRASGHGVPSTRTMPQFTSNEKQACAEPNELMSWQVLVGGRVGTTRLGSQPTAGGRLQVSHAGTANLSVRNHLRGGSLHADASINSDHESPRVERFAVPTVGHMQSHLPSPAQPAIPSYQTLSLCLSSQVAAASSLVNVATSTGPCWWCKTH